MYLVIDFNNLNQLSLINLVTSSILFRPREGCNILKIPYWLIVSIGLKEIKIKNSTILPQSQRFFWFSICHPRAESRHFTHYTQGMPYTDEAQGTTETIRATDS